MAHSYSSWSTYNKCAAKYKFSYIDRLPRSPPSPQMQRGTDIHENVEHFLLGKKERIEDKAIHKLNGLYMTNIKSIPSLEPEYKFGLTKKFEFTEFDDDKTYLRGVIDLKAKTEEHVKLFEWKTGKMYDEHADQIHLYGMVGLIEHDVPFVEVNIRYLDFGTDKSETYTREQLKMMKLRWKDRLKQIDTDKTFAPNPSYLCRWCDFSREKGGPCRVA